MGKPSSVNLLVQTRTKMKSHKAAANRFIKRASGLKRKQAGVNHGNGRFSYSALKGLRGFVEVSNKEVFEKVHQSCCNINPCK